MHRLVLLMVTLALLPGCGGGPGGWPVFYDLVSGFAVADAWSETRSIDLGTARGRRYLVSGWSHDRWDRRRERSFVLGEGGQSVLRFELIEPRSLVFRFYVGLADPEGEVAVELEPMINGNRLETLTLDGRPRRHRLSVANGSLRSGENELILHYRLNQPMLVDQGPKAPGSLVAWYQADLLFGDETEAPQPFVTSAGDALMIPFGSRLEYYLKLPHQSFFTADRLQYVGEAHGQLSLVLEQDGEAPVELPLSGEAQEQIELPLVASESRIVRVTLRADNGGAGATDRGGVILSSPAIRSPAEPRGEQEREEEPAVAPAVSARPNILLYVVDTLRADHLGLYGYPKPVSPELDRFAGEATVFDNAVAQSSWTRAAMASIFTGLWPLKHATNGRRDVLDPNATTLAEILDEAGYYTVAKVRNWNVFPVFGFRQGFQEFRRIREGKADRLNRLVEAWLTSRPDDRPFFLWVHTVDPHEPYRPPAATRELFMEDDQEQFDLDKHPGFKRTRAMSEAERQSVVRYLFSLYDAEIAHNDRAFGDLLAILRDQGLLDSTVVVFVSDHGEEFLEHGTWGHGRNLHAENLNVPLLIRFPDRGHGLRVAEVVQQIDLMPTLLDYVGVPIPGTVDGRSFLSLLSPDREAVLTESRPAFSFLHLDGAPNRSLVDAEWKLVQRLSEEGRVTWTGLFNRQADAGERDNRILEQPIRARFMELVLDAKMAEGSLLTTEEAVLDQETEEALKALGYLQ